MFSLLRMGELYSEGKYFPRNYTKAYEYFSKVVKSKNANQENERFIASLAYFTIGYYNHYGLGVPRNLTKAIRLYNNSIATHDKSYFFVSAYMTLAELERHYLHNPDKPWDQDKSIAENVLADIFNPHGLLFTRFIVLLLLGMLVTLTIYKQRLKNYISIYYTEHTHDQ